MVRQAPRTNGTYSLTTDINNFDSVADFVVRLLSRSVGQAILCNDRVVACGEIGGYADCEVASFLAMTVLLWLWWFGRVVVQTGLIVL